MNFFALLGSIAFSRKEMALRQTCKVRVSGRRMRYRRALQTIQDEEYLSAIDLDDIRQRRLLLDSQRPWRTRIRKKRQTTTCKFLL